MTVQGPKTVDLMALYVAYLGEAREVRKLKAMMHKELAAEEYQSALANIDLVAAAQAAAAHREADKMELEAALRYIGAGVELIGSVQGLSRVKETKAELAKGRAAAAASRRSGGPASPLGSDASASPEGPNPGPDASRQSTLAASTPPGSENEKKQPDVSMVDALSKGWDTANQVGVPDNEANAVQDMRERAGDMQRALQSTAAFDQSMQEWTSTESSLGSMLRQLAKTGRAL